MTPPRILKGEARGAERGFTLIEILVTITVAGILLGIAVPAFQSFVQNDRDSGQAMSLVSSFNYARSEAIKRASPTGITVCPSAAGLACDAGSTAWSLGWIVIDTNAADCAPAAACTALQTVAALAGSNTLTAVGPAKTGITFLSSGLVTPAGANPALTIRICDTRGASKARDVEVNSTGRIAASSSQTPGFSVSGAALVCP
jgi:type IV fimbrial biogenesis protein FimT